VERSCAGGLCRKEDSIPVRELAWEQWCEFVVGSARPTKQAVELENFNRLRVNQSMLNYYMSRIS